MAVRLNRRGFDVLLYLVMNPGRVVTKEESLGNVRADAVVDEKNLNQSISALRKALEGRAAAPQASGLAPPRPRLPAQEAVYERTPVCRSSGR